MEQTQPLDKSHDQKLDRLWGSRILKVEIISQVAILVLASLAIAEMIPLIVFGPCVLGIGAGVFLIQYPFSNQMSNKTLIIAMAFLAIYPAVFGSLSVSSTLSMKTVGWILIAPKILAASLFIGYQAAQSTCYSQKKELKAV